MANADDRLQTNPIVEALLPTPDGQRRAALVGFAGPSNVEDKARLYTDLSFRTYFEFPVDAIIGSQPAKAGDANGPVVVILDPKTQVDKVTIERTSGDAAFLAGDISDSHYASAQPFGGIGGGGAQGANCVCLVFSAVGNTLAGQVPAVDCACILVSAVGNTLERAPVDCACVLLSAIGNTLAAAAPRAPYCCNPTYTAGNCTRGGPTMAAAPGAAVGGPMCCNPTYTAGHCTRAGVTMGPPPAAMDCLNLAQTTVCTPTGVPYLCPAG